MVNVHDLHGNKEQMLTKLERAVQLHTENAQRAADCVEPHWEYKTLKYCGGQDHSLNTGERRLHKHRPVLQR